MSKRKIIDPKNESNEESHCANKQPRISENFLNVGISIKEENHLEEASFKREIPCKYKLGLMRLLSEHAY